ncbi:hypothetical protein GCM10007231_14920 [Nocardioides daphniae]|uniref:Uncharacterized protein n=1 Tax=Nocardioides daphniae TaxID=402297 RepID=A0ABQ1Q7K5_9ACTN|nr:hypothetical protein GCM10007231_14920 [Nocardioides daphniae]
MPLWKSLAQFYATFLIGGVALVLLLHWAGIEEEPGHFGWLFPVLAAAGTYGRVSDHREAVTVGSSGGARRAPWLRATQHVFGWVAAFGAIGVAW